MNNKKRAGKRIAAVVLSAVFLIALSIGGTMAFLVDKDNSVENTFNPASVTCEVDESFDGITKSNVNVKNTSNIDAYIRVKLVTYRVNDEGQHIGGTATIPSFTPGTNWVKCGDYYYYTLPVAPGATPATRLIGKPGITLEDAYTDADGGKQVIEVMAEAIQAGSQSDVDAAVVAEAWGVVISANSVTAAE